MNQEKSQKKNQWVRGAGRLEKGVFQSQEAWSLKEKTTWISVLLVLGAHSARTVILYDRSNACTVSQPITGFSTQTGHDKRAPPNHFSEGRACHVRVLELGRDLFLSTEWPLSAFTGRGNS